MNPFHLCPRCGVQLAAGTPPEKCPRCLLRLAAELGSDPGSGDRPVAPTPEELAPGFPQLEITEVIGQGGMGVVYRARQKGLDREVALKVLHVDAKDDAAFAERFAREARALASLTHPNIVAVHDSGVTDGRYWLLMEYVDGTDLRAVMRAGEVQPAEALSLVSQLCEALNYAHEQGVVHRDIKPENILVDRCGRLKVADFGLAKILRRAPEVPTLTGPNQAMGTYHYMAPEQIERPLDVDHRADIYSLGVVFYELLTGGLPLGRFGPPSDTLGVDLRLDEVVLRTLEKEPHRRYQHASEVKTRVDAIRDGEAPEPAATGREEAHRHGRGHGDGHRRRGKSLGWFVAAGCLLLVLLSFGGAASLAFLGATRGTAAEMERQSAEVLLAEARAVVEERRRVVEALGRIRSRVEEGEVKPPEAALLAEEIVALDTLDDGAATFLALVQNVELTEFLRVRLFELARSLAPSDEREDVFTALSQ